MIIGNFFPTLFFFSLSIYYNITWMDDNNQKMEQIDSKLKIKIKI